MAETSVVLTFRNEAEARLLEAVLVERDIPHYIRSFGDSAYGPIYQAPLGWGQLEAPREYHERIVALYEDLTTEES